MTMHGVPPGIAAPPPPVVVEEEHPVEGEGRLPVGTIVLAFVFLAAFVLYYFVNWKLLSGVWSIG